MAEALTLAMLFGFQGQTGFPWIDACMRQLRIEGWVHHVARHAVACFLTRGDLWLSWEDGLKVRTCKQAVEGYQQEPNEGFSGGKSITHPRVLLSGV